MSKLVLRYSIIGINLADAMVLKTFMRLLENSLDHQWCYEACGHSTQWESVSLANTDLWIVSEEILQQWQAQQHGPENPAALLVMGSDSLAQNVRSLSKPLTADKLTPALTAAGRDLAAARLAKDSAASIPDSKDTQNPAQSNPVSTPSSWLDEPIKRFKTLNHFETASSAVAAQDSSPAPAASHQLDPSASFKLKRWPAAQYLKSQAELRIATALTGRALTINELIIVAREDQSTCEMFIIRLLDLELLQQTQPSHSMTVSMSAEKPRQKIGLLGMIRQRLGL